MELELELNQLKEENTKLKKIVVRVDACLSENIQEENLFTPLALFLTCVCLCKHFSLV